MTSPRVSPELAELIKTAPPCPLGPGQPVDSAYDTLQSLSVESLSGDPVKDREMAEACLSGLWLLFNYLDKSHEISQNLPSSTGSYWHGIMHRREPDYSNAKYWFRRTGHHLAMDSLGLWSQELAAHYELDSHTEFLRSPRWDAMAMVDACQAVASGKSQNEELLQQVAQAEWNALFNHCYAAAF